MKIVKEEDDKAELKRLTLESDAAEAKRIADSE